MLRNTPIPRTSPALDVTVIKYVKVVLATYILAVGLGMVSGFDVFAYFNSFLKHPWSLYASQGFVIFCALMLLTGLYVRLISLCLSIVILSASVHLNMMNASVGSMDAFGADLVLICAILACFWPGSARKFRKPTPVENAADSVPAKSDRVIKIVPRRVALDDAPQRVAARQSASAIPLVPVPPVFEQPDVIMARITDLIAERTTPNREPQAIYA